MSTLMKPAEGELSRVIAGPESSSVAPSLIEVLWHRRWLIAAVIGVFLTIALLYLLVATPVYEATARLRLSQSPPRPFGDSSGYVDRSENFLQTQADTVASLPVLQRALERLDTTKLQTFATAKGDPAQWLRRKGLVRVQPSRKADILTVSVESPYQDETTLIANAVVEAYIEEQSHYRHAIGQTMIEVLSAERETLQRRRQQLLSKMAAYQNRLGLVSLRQDRGSTLMERTQTLANALTAAEMQAMELRAEYQAAQDVLRDPQRIADFVESRQSQGRDSGDAELAQLRQQYMQHTLTMASLQTTHGENHPRTVAMRQVMEALQEQINEKQVALVKAYAASLETQYQASMEKIGQLREALAAQRGMTANVSPEMAEYLTLEAEVDRLQRQDELLSNRIAEVSVNSVQTGPLSVQIIEPAIAGRSPIKPNKKLILAAAMVMGWVVGVGLALLREWQDTSLRTPEEIPVSLGTTLLAMIPQVNPRLSPVARGQLVYLDSCSAAAEAYRGIRTSISLGVAQNARTILVASPATGDGKSTTASNLAIAFAQAGERTLLIDCDLRNPVQHLLFEADATVGLTNVIAGEAQLRDAIRPAILPGLFLLPCGPIPKNPAELLISSRFKQLMQMLTESFDRIIIDSPPLMSVTDARILAADADATLLVLRMNKSMRELGIMALDGLDSVGARVIGAVANDVPPSRSAKYYGGHWPYATPQAELVNRSVSLIEHNTETETETATAEPADEKQLHPQFAGMSERD